MFQDIVEPTEEEQSVTRGSNEILSRESTLANDEDDDDNECGMCLCLSGGSQCFPFGLVFCAENSINVRWGV